jgi:hypothetical protein
MKVLRIATFVILTGTALFAQSDAQKALDHFKAMEGTWVGKGARGDTAEVTYRVIAGGTSVMADIKMGDESMTSLYYVDGQRLMMTHFCPSNNQPRMQATISSEGKIVTFDFLDATNLASPSAGTCTRRCTASPLPTITVKIGRGSTKARMRTCNLRCSGRSERGSAGVSRAAL